MGNTLNWGLAEPVLRGWAWFVALPAGARAAGAAVALWIVVRLARRMGLLMPGLVLGGALVWALIARGGWSAWLAVPLGGVVMVLVVLALARVVVARYAVAGTLVAGAMITLWLAASAGLGRWWALPVLAWGTWLLIGLARQIADAHEQPLAILINEWIEDLIDP